MYQDNSIRRHAIIYTILGVLLVGASIFAIYQFKQKQKLEIQLDNQYARSFYEMTEHVENIETDLRKSMLVSTPAQLAHLAGNIYRTSNSAKACLGELPTSSLQLDNTSRFLSQVGDYTYVLSQNAINGESISDEQYKDIASLTEYAAQLSKALSETRTAVENGDVTFTAENGINVAYAANGIIENLENVETSFQEYPSLIYDGPFSEHIENMQSPMLSEATEIGVEEARRRASEFLKLPPELAIYDGDTNNTAMDSYNFCTDSEERQCVSITKKGGLVLFFIKNRDVKEEKLNFDEATRYAQDFLQKNGFYSLEQSYYEKLDGIAVINFAYVQDGVKCYSDLIKVKVALDNGEILGLETGGYLMNHESRAIGQPAISMQDAAQKLSPHLEYKSGSLALIPKDSLEEVLCYEFHGSFAGRNYIVYVNAFNGREEKILMLIESENGILTI